MDPSRLDRCGSRSPLLERPTRHLLETEHGAADGNAARAGLAGLEPVAGRRSGAAVPSRVLSAELRGWFDFGTGAMGDMAVHNMDPAFYALDLDAPTAPKRRPASR